jgi:hypothetical protein
MTLLYKEMNVAIPNSRRMDKPDSILMERYGS